MLHLKLSPAEAGNVVSQLPVEARRMNSGVVFANDDADENGAQPDLGTLSIPDQWASAAQAADPAHFVNNVPIAKASIAAAVIAQDKAAPFAAAIGADPNMNLRWMGLDSFPADDADLRALMVGAGVDPDAALGL